MSSTWNHPEKRPLFLCDEFRQRQCQEEWGLYRKNDRPGRRNLHSRNAGSDENALSTMNMDFESFYAAAKDADVLIYNSTIDGELTAIDELCAKNQLFADFKAVKEGNVWCTGKNMFQETMGLGI